ncbi:MAG: radical SAM protein [Actinomycetia bacterium]|nr:radical SAM protein [Actinomycetes bacterium]
MVRLLGVPFTPADPARTAAEVLAECVGPPGLYLHVPFCSQLCPFCPYNKVPFQPRLARAHMGLVEQELRWYTQAASEPFTSLYVGGGTPTLCREQLRMLSDVPVVGERAIEVLPSHMTPRVSAELQKLGFDAVSIGVQSFDDAVLHHLGRPTNAATNRRAVAVAREQFGCVDVDLIFDVAYRGTEGLLADLREAFAAGVDQVSTYPLMRFGYTPFGKADHDRKAEHAVLAAATELAQRHGYRRDSVWTFVREGGGVYTSITRPYFVGVGAGAATFTGRSFAVNHFGLDQYAAAVLAGQLPIGLMATLPRPLARAYRSFWQAYTGRINSVAGDEATDRLLDHRSVRAALAAMQRLGWVETEAQGYHLTDRGYDRYHDIERWVTYHLIEPLWAQMMTEHGLAEDYPESVSAAG